MKRELKVVGLTGGIGTGKSTAADYLRSRGFAHIDADAIGREITADGSPMLPVLNELFGPSGVFGKAGVEILHSDGSLDRPALASLVFTDKARKQQLDKVMFEAIISEIDRQIDEFRKDAENVAAPAGIILDAPLLFEAGLESRCDLILLLVADEDVRIRRVCSRDGVTARDVRNRINSQLSDDEKRKKSHIVIDNSGTKEELEVALEGFCKNF